MLSVGHAVRGCAVNTHAANATEGVTLEDLFGFQRRVRATPDYIVTVAVVSNTMRILGVTAT